MVRFYEGRNDEDTFFTYELAKAIRNSGWVVVEITSVVYHYRIRLGSICNDMDNPLIKDRIDTLDEIYEDCIIFWPELSHWVEELKIKTLYWNLQRVYKDPSSEVSSWKSYQNMLRSFRLPLILRVFKRRT